ncbi:MAG: hypothetical protein HKN94_17125 [Acidimicrobiales bacterium]|nr:hypothetical protein [Acidimicrobiales bacterium]
MTTSWTRAWLAALVLLVAAGAIAAAQHDMLLEVEEPVMEWLLDDADTSGWDRAEGLLSSTLVWGGTILLAVVGAYFNRWVGATAIAVLILGRIIATITQNVVERAAPVGAESGFPHIELVQSTIFFGLVVLFAWWFGAPKLVWHILLEIAIFATLLSSVRLIIRGQIWPSDVIGAMLVASLSLIIAAAILEAQPFARRQSPAEPESSVLTG